jgi:hypothetical protein
LNLSKWMALVLAEMLIFFTVMESPNLFQTMLWRIGLITYTLPMVFLSLLTGLILNGVLKSRDGIQPRRGQYLGLMGCAAVAFLAGGLSETYLALQTGLLGLAFLCAFLGAKGKIKPSWLLWLGSSLFGSSVAMVTVLLAPGNLVRQASMPPPPGVWGLILSSAVNAFLFIYISLQEYSFQIMLLFLLSMLLSYILGTTNSIFAKPHSTWLVSALFLAPVIGYLMVICICAPSVYAQSSYPEARVLIEARFVMVLLTCVQGLIIGIGLGQLHTLSNEPPPVFLMVVVVLVSSAILLYPLYDARKIYSQVPDYRASATAWDGRNAQVIAEKAQGFENIQVKEFDGMSGISELSQDAGFWVNGCAADFYGVRTIEAITPP